MGNDRHRGSLDVAEGREQEQEEVAQQQDEDHVAQVPLAKGFPPRPVAVEEGQAAGGVETGWSTDGFDPTGEIRNLLRAMYPDNTTPVRLMGYLVDEGLRRISAKIDEGNDSPLDFLD